MWNVSTKTTPCTITAIQKAIANNMYSPTITNINHPFAAADVCFPINHQEPDYLLADKDGFIMDKPTNAELEA